MSGKRPSVGNIAEGKRREALDEGVRITLGEDVYEVRAGDLTALHERALRKQYGCPFYSLIEEFETTPGLDSLAAIVWLARYMGGETELTYDEVASGVNVEFAEAVIVDGTETEKADSPEA